jgi:hypothetical protein
MADIRTDTTMNYSKKDFYLRLDKPELKEKYKDNKEA